MAGAPLVGESKLLPKWPLQRIQIFLDLGDGPEMTATVPGAVDPREIYSLLFLADR